MAKHAGGRPKGSKTSFKGHRDKGLVKREKKAEFISAESLKTYNDPKSTPEAKAAAWQTHLTMEKRLTRFALERKKQKEKDQRAAAIAASFDPASTAPDCLKACTHISCAPGCPRPAWEDRQRAYYAANPEQKPKPAPVIAQPAPAPTYIHEEPVVVVAPPPAPKMMSMPKITLRTVREGTSGKFFVENFWSKPLYERNAIVETLKPDERAEWQQILDEQRMRAARVMAEAAKETKSKPMSEAEKIKFNEVQVRPATKDLPMSPDKFRETFGSTAGNPGEAVSVPIDRRTWLPDLNPLTQK